MRHKVAGRKLSRNTSHRMLMLKGQVSELLDHGRIKTTVAKAKEVRSLTEKVITSGRLNKRIDIPRPTNNIV